MFKEGSTLLMIREGSKLQIPHWTGHIAKSSRSEKVLPKKTQIILTMLIKEDMG